MSYLKRKIIRSFISECRKPEKLEKKKSLKVLQCKFYVVYYTIRSGTLKIKNQTIAFFKSYSGSKNLSKTIL